MLNIHFLYLIQTNIINQVCSGGVLWIFIQKKRIFLFDALGLEGFKFFIVNNDERVINELLFDDKKCNTNLNNHKLKLCAMKFCIQTWEKMPNNKKEQLTDIAQLFFIY